MCPIFWSDCRFGQSLVAFTTLPRGYWRPSAYFPAISKSYLSCRVVRSNEPMLSFCFGSDSIYRGLPAAPWQSSKNGRQSVGRKSRVRCADHAELETIMTALKGNLIIYRESPEAASVQLHDYPRNNPGGCVKGSLDCNWLFTDVFGKHHPYRIPWLIFGMNNDRRVI